MRLNMLSGGALAIAGAIAVMLSGFLRLEVDHVALLGLALGAVVGLVPQGRSLQRLLGFGAGFVLAWAGYLVRAAVLPDSTSGRAVAVVVVVLACTAVYLATVGRLALWATFVGVAAMVGAYEEAYTAAPSQVLDQSPTAATAILLTAAIGYLVSALFAPVTEPVTQRRQAVAAPDNYSIDDLLTESAR